MNICNKLTVLRIFLSFICIGLVIRNTLTSLTLAFAVFVIASVTDFLDGFLARRKNLVSDLGKLLDPIADKILIIGVFLAFLQVGIINAWMVSVIMLREFIITSLRLYSLNRGIILEAKTLGKHKTVSQVIGIFLIFITLILFKVTQMGLVYFLYYRLIPVVMWYIVIITLFSGVNYLWTNRRAIRTF
ncbi:MAG: CDP-diacylglycerol--glycerol-3-phosphate 3-phosphatidyltransferase [Candidatus Omnitrophota bacterium]|nr:MAG: CDP-diacylglycerol--glycerol-3-phosphate 3-phosphatidyltransferase [Candidatus Omnitrophota bacterium]